MLAAGDPEAGAAGIEDPPTGALLAGAEPPKLKLGAAAGTEPVAAIVDMPRLPKLGAAGVIDVAAAAAALPKEKVGAEAAVADALLTCAAVAELTAASLLSGFAVENFEAPVVSALFGLDLVLGTGPKLKAGDAAGAVAGMEGSAGAEFGLAPKAKPPKEPAAAGWLGPAGKIANSQCTTLYTWAAWQGAYGMHPDIHSKDALIVHFLNLVVQAQLQDQPLGYMPKLNACVCKIRLYTQLVHASSNNSTGTSYSRLLEANLQ